MSDNTGIVKVVAIAFFNPTDQKYLICRRGPAESGAGAWEFPGGKVDQGETNEQALAREIQEELGVHIIVTKLKFISDHNHQYINKNIHIYLYKYDVISLDYTLIDHDQSAWVDIDQMMTYNLAEADVPFVKKLKLI